MPKLTDTQLVILSAAAQHDDGAVLPLPDSLTLNKGAAASVLKGLTKKGLIAERPAPAGVEVWRENDDGERLTLAITEAGLNAIGIEPDDKVDTQSATTPSKPKKRREAIKSSADTSARPGTKQALLVDLLKRKTGATIDEVVEATGWQAHSVRGAISGTLKKTRSRRDLGEGRRPRPGLPHCRPGLIMQTRARIPTICTRDDDVGPYLLCPLRTYAQFLRDQAEPDRRANESGSRDGEPDVIRTGPKRTGSHRSGGHAHERAELR